MNQYESQREPIGTPAVRTSLTEDLYLSIHNIDPGNRTVGLLVLVNPMVGWIWIATAHHGARRPFGADAGVARARVPVTERARVATASPEGSS